MPEPIANSGRGEARLDLGAQSYLLRSTFAALVAAEDEIGSLFEMVERAAAGKLKLAELAALYWHCLYDAPQDLQRSVFNEQVMSAGLVKLTPPLKILLRQILQGQ